MSLTSLEKENLVYACLLTYDDQSFRMCTIRSHKTIPNNYRIWYAAKNSSIIDGLIDIKFRPYGGIIELKGTNELGKSNDTQLKIIESGNAISYSLSHGHYKYFHDLIKALP